MSLSVVGPWAKDKLDRLKQYLEAYTTILSKQKWCQGFHYIDAFAGPGTHEIRVAGKRLSPVEDLFQSAAEFLQESEEQRQFLAGSPRVALEISHPFSTYVFVEKSPERVAELENLKKEFEGSRKVGIRQRDCTAFLRDRVANNENVDWRTNRAVVFLDPFGMQVGWPTIELLAKTKAIEVFVNFPVGMAIQRLLLRSGEFTEPQRRKLDEYFGSSEWFNEIYKKRKADLFGDEPMEKVEKSGERLAKWYRDRLAKAFGHASKAALIRNTKRGHLYYLMLASPKANAVKIADHILGAGEYV